MGARVPRLPSASDDALLVTAADKLHNARAISTDLLLVGPSVMNRFKASPDQVLWYHKSVLAVLQERGFSPFLVSGLEQAISDLERLLT